MKALIALVIVGGLFYLGKYLINHFEPVSTQELRQKTVERGAHAPVLPGLPLRFEASLDAAKRQGASGLGQWLELYRGHVSDPRLAEIELDYVVLLNAKDPKAARALYQKVKGRVGKNSPVYPRIEQLGRTYD